MNVYERGLSHREYLKKTRKNTVLFLRPEISGIHEEKRTFIGTISELLSDIYPRLNVNLSDPILSLSLSSFLFVLSVSVACPASSPWRREIVDPIEFSTVLDNNAECLWRFHIWKWESTVKNYRILDTIHAFILVLFISPWYFYFLYISCVFHYSTVETVRNIFIRSQNMS